MTDSLTLTQRIQEDMKTAMRAGAKQQLGVIRLILAAIKQREVDERIVLDDNQVVAVLDKMLKQRRESIEQYEKAAREDLAAQERFEVTVLQQYMPQQMSEAEIVALVQQAIAETGANSAKDMGKVMNLIRPQMQGRADMKVVSDLVKKQLS
ncbi:MAG: GatB/YqeY domain-containing protein [Thiotrichaceae bacterium]